VSWVTKKLGDLLKIQNGYAFDSKLFSSDGEMPLIRIRDIKKGVDTETLYTGDYDVKYVVKKGDLLIGMDGEFGCYEWKGNDALLNQRVCRLQEFENQIYPRFLLYGINSYLKAIEDVTGYTTVKHISSKQIANIEFPLPPLVTQKKIVSKLDEIFIEIDKATTAAKANAKNAEALYTSFLIEFFTRKIADSKIFNLSDLCLSLHQGLNTAGEKVKFYDSGYPIIQTRNIDNGIIDITEKLKFLSVEDWMKYKDKFKPEIGDVFFTNIGTIGKTAIVQNMEDYLIHWNIFKIRPNFNMITSKYMKLILDYLTLSGYFSDRQKGGTVEFVTKKMISDVSIAIPSLSSQNDLTNKNDSFFEFCDLLKESYLNKLNELQKLKVSILKQAFNGELVRE
jgi:type I restriction enzyme S subunit